MLLVIDIGNTDTTLGVFEGEELRATWHMATTIHRLADEYAALLFNLLRHQHIDTSDIKEVLSGISIFRHWWLGLGLRPGFVSVWTIRGRLALTAS